MARNLYRFYLYTIFIVLLLFATVALGQLLSALLLLIPFLRSSYENAPDAAHITQSLVFALVSWAIAGLLGGLHYWLIRRDMHNDPAAGESAIRSFFLNITAAIGISLAVPFVGFSVLEQLAYSGQYGLVGVLSFALPTLALVGLLQLERRRTQTTTGAALAFQRLHIYAVQLLFLIVLAFAWERNVNSLIDTLFFGGRGMREYCGSPANCQNVHIAYLLLTLLWFVSFWLAYGWLTRNDTSKLLRFILHFSSIAVGVSMLLTGFYRGVLLLLLPAFKLSFGLKDVTGPNAQYDFVPFLLLAVLVIGLYHLLLTRAAKRGLIERGEVFATETSIATILTALLFWFGIALLLYNGLRALNAASPEAQVWAQSVTLVIVGLVYIPLDILLWRRNIAEPTVYAGARRGFVLAVLGVAILACAIGGAVALYSWTTSLFGSPIANWLQVTHAGLAACIVGGIVTALYLTVAIRERLFSGLTKRGTPVVSAPMPVAPIPAITIESVLDELLAGKITRDEAAQRIRDLEKGLVSVGNER
ncbi:MAG: hypothetical protein PVS3B3_17900 [Ktedonobacteraceae bacterium]